ncbi:MAG TPA: hypothetical protein VI139_06640 [Gemmatimonadales bacterium]
MDNRRLYAAVAACAVVVYIGALWNRFVFDDVYIVGLNGLVHQPSGIWRAFAQPYWPPNLSGTLYRPLTVATYALDWIVGKPWWFHLVNILWHAGASVAVAALARRWSGTAAALVAGLIFAVHPVHVEAVANVVGRNELMAALFTVLAVYAALVRQSIGWTAVAMAAGILSKENAAVAPGLIVLGWLVGLAPIPPRRRLVAFGATWGVLAIVYATVRWAVLHPYAGVPALAPAFLDQSPVTVRLTAVAAFTDLVRLLLFPLHLSADYSPNDRTVVTTMLDSRFLLGLLCFALWGGLLALAWRRGRRVEAFGIGWIGLAYLPVANLLFPHAVVVAERLLYLPSAGLALAAGAALAPLPPRRLAVVLSTIVVAGGVRSAVRVPVWRDNSAAAVSLLKDAPDSYRTWDYLGWELVWRGESDRALVAFRRAGEIYPKDARIWLVAAHMAYALHRPAVADSLLVRADSACDHCVGAYRNQAGAARLRGDSAAADSLEAHARRFTSQP